MTAEPAMSDPVAGRVRELVEQAPPLTDEQRARLRALLNPQPRRTARDQSRRPVALLPGPADAGRCTGGVVMSDDEDRRDGRPGEQREEQK